MKNTLAESLTAPSRGGFSRRHFLGFAGLAASAVALTLSSCNKDDEAADNRLDLGSGDAGLLNYAYALEQLEAAFYNEVIMRVGSDSTLFNAGERDLLTDIRDHEAAHRAFFKTLITNSGATPIADLTTDFSAVDFSSRASILAAARTLEDLGVAAYNGAANLFTSATYLAIAGQIVSVEARHAAYIRELNQPGSFANLLTLEPLGARDLQGLDVSLTPPQVIALAGRYLVEDLNADNLPTA